MEIVVSVAVSFVIGVIIMEGYAWLDALATKLLDRAVQQVSAEYRDRCREEWRADLATMPNSLSKVAFALLNFTAVAKSMNAEFMEAEFEEMDSTLEDIIAKHKSAKAQICEAKLLHETTRGRIAATMAAAMPELRKPSPLGDKFKTVVDSFERFGTLLASESDLSHSLLDRHILKFDARLQEVDGLLASASEKCRQAKELRHQHGLASLLPLKRDLDKIRVIFSDDQWGDDEAMKEHDKVRARIDQLVASVGKKSTSAS
jgi:hypothetical protein